jgi:transcriptional regulator with XRE-family HTH domain
MPAPSIYAERNRERNRRRLRVLRKAVGLSQLELAQLAGTHQSMVSLAERGVASARVLEALARTLGADDPAGLLDLVEPGSKV